MPKPRRSVVDGMSVEQLRSSVQEYHYNRGLAEQRFKLTEEQLAALEKKNDELAEKLLLAEKQLAAGKKPRGRPRKKQQQEEEDQGAGGGGEEEEEKSKAMAEQQPKKRKTFGSTQLTNTTKKAKNLLLLGGAQSSPAYSRLLAELKQGNRPTALERRGGLLAGIEPTVSGCLTIVYTTLTCEAILFVKALVSGLGAIQKENPLVVFSKPEDMTAETFYQKIIFAQSLLGSLFLQNLYYLQASDAKAIPFKTKVPTTRQTQQHSFQSSLRQYCTQHGCNMAQVFVLSPCPPADAEFLVKATLHFTSPLFVHFDQHFPLQSSQLCLKRTFQKLDCSSFDDLYGTMKFAQPFVNVAYTTLKAKEPQRDRVPFLALFYYFIMCNLHSKMHMDTIVAKMAIQSAQYMIPAFCLELACAFDVHSLELPQVTEVLLVNEQVNEEEQDPAQEIL